MTENDVVKAVVTYLLRQGFRIDGQLTTLQRGIDIEATSIATKRRMLVEAKGGTSSQPGTKRHGKAFTPNQKLSHVSRAFFTAAKLTQKFRSEEVCVALAFPDDTRHRKLVGEISSVLDLLRIPVFFAMETGSVEVLGHDRIL